MIRTHTFDTCVSTFYRIHFRKKKKKKRRAYTYVSTRTHVAYTRTCMRLCF